MGSSVLNGLGAGPSETLMPQVAVDVVFLHDRGKYQILYFSVCFISLIVGPVIASSMAQSLGWRSFWWLYAALLLATLVCNVLFFPKTRYRRSTTAFRIHVVEAAATSPAASSGEDDSSQTNEEETPSSAPVSIRADWAVANDKPLE
jgi:MFS family permease